MVSMVLMWWCVLEEIFVLLKIFPFIGKDVAVNQHYVF